MASYQITTGLLGLGLAALIAFLLRRDHLYVLHGLFWIFVACAALLLGLWPGLIDKLASAVGISYAPALVLLLGILALIIKALYADISHTQLERQVRLLNQRLAVIEFENTRMETSAAVVSTSVEKV